MKHLLLIFVLTNTAFCDTLPTAKEAMDRTNKALENQKTQCVKDWEQEIEDQIYLTIDSGQCNCTFFVPDCVSKNFFQGTFRKLKKLGYWIRPLGKPTYNVSWCRK